MTHVGIHKAYQFLKKESVAYTMPGMVRRLAIVQGVIFDKIIESEVELFDGADQMSDLIAALKNCEYGKPLPMDLSELRTTKSARVASLLLLSLRHSVYAFANIGNEVNYKLMHSIEKSVYNLCMTSTLLMDPNATDYYSDDGAEVIYNLLADAFAY